MGGGTLKVDNPFIAEIENGSIQFRIDLSVDSVNGAVV